MANDGLLLLLVNHNSTDTWMGRGSWWDGRFVVYPDEIKWAGPRASCSI